MENTRRINDLPATEAAVKTLYKISSRYMYFCTYTSKSLLLSRSLLNFFFLVLIVTFLIAVCLVAQDDMMLTMTTMMTK